MCNPATTKCDTFSNTLAALGYPTVVGGDAEGWKSCKMATDCTYDKNGVTATPVESVKSVCPAPMMDETESLCIMGGGEKAMRRLAEMV